MRVQFARIVAHNAASSARFSESIVIEFGTPREVLFECATALEFGDELRLMVFPTVLGRGKRLFPDGIDRLKLKLTECRQVGLDGVQVQVYQRPD